MKEPRTEPRNEGELQKWFINELKKEGILAYKFSSPAKKGVPDLIIVGLWGAGTCTFVEMKSPTGKGVLSELQKYQIKKLLDGGAEVYVAATVADCFDIVNDSKKRLTYADL